MPTMSPIAWQGELAALGFAPGAGAGTYELDGMEFRHDGAWCSLRTTSAVPADPLRGQLGKPGLWKRVRNAGDRAHLVFDLPAMPHGDEADDESPDRDSSLLAWAVATLAGQVPAEWQAPPRRIVDGWLRPGVLTVQAGQLLRQCVLVHRPDRLALTCQLLSAISRELPDWRRAWLHEVVLDAQDRWRLVRFGLAGGDQPAILAEVDFTGCPPASLESVFAIGLGALRWVIAWLVQSADFLGEPGQPSRALEVCSPRASWPA
jgi:hypothetical protein